jgi:hypothetical protein
MEKVIIMLGLVKGTVLGAVGYYIVDTVIGQLVTGTTAADNIITNLVPIVFGLGIAIFVIIRAFALGGTSRD